MSGRDESPAAALPSGAPRPADGRAYLGLALLGWGLSILLGVTPHEDLVVGAALTAFGAALLVTARRLPAVGHVSPFLVTGAGLAMACGVLLYDAGSGAASDVPKVVLIVLGSALVAVTPFLQWRIRLPRRMGSSTTVATLVACALPVLGGPLAVWAAQAAFKSALGTTPIEAFVRVGLLAPLGVLLPLLGLHTSQAGQTVTYMTRNGPLSLEVGAACSGVQAMALFSGVLALYLIAERPGGRRLALWSVIGLVGVYVANLLRLVMLFLVGYEWGGDALLRAHAQAGWIFFVAWALLFARMARVERRPGQAA